MASYLFHLTLTVKRKKLTLNAIKRFSIILKKIASVAAPTASLHFDEELLAKLEQKNIQKSFVTLHVGAGTFMPVRTDDITNHVMHSEWCDVPQETIDLILATKARGNKVIAIGTTATRAFRKCSSSS